MTPEQALRDRLLADATVSALVVATESGVVRKRVYPKRLPQAATLPALTYQRISNRDNMTQDGRSGLQRPRVQVDAWARTYDAAVALQEAVKAAVHAKEWTAANGSRVVGQFDSDRDGPDDDEGDQDPDLVTERRSADYFIHFGTGNA